MTHQSPPPTIHQRQTTQTSLTARRRRNTMHTACRTRRILPPPCFFTNTRNHPAMISVNSQKFERRGEKVACFSPKIELFNPFVIPFQSTSVDSGSQDVCISYTISSIVDPEVSRYMKSGSKRLEIVAKCTPCQCCACR